MKKYRYDELMIEITRKCNLKCAHCLRGDAQNATMSKRIIDRIFEDAADCKQILFTGGEPLLALDEIEYFVDKLIASDWTTSNIAMTINGTIRNPKLIDIANKFCRNRNGSKFQIIVSDDEFHDKNESESTVKFYQNFDHEPLVFVIPQNILIRNVQEEFTLAGRAIEYYKNHPQLDKKWAVRKEEQTNHRICIIGDTIPCAMYVLVNGGVGLYVADSFDKMDELSFGSLLQSSMSELIDNHNDTCLVSCHDAYLINFYRNVTDPNNLLSEAISRVNVGIFNRIINARKQARKLYPYVTAHDIMVAIPFPDFIIDQKFYSEMISLSEDLTDDEIMQFADSDLVKSLSSFTNKALRSTFKQLLHILALIQKPNTIIAPNKVYGTGNLADTPEFTELATLNHKYQIGELKPNNSVNFRCEAVYGKSFRDYEVEKIQNSDLPEQIKLLSLRKDELEQKLVSKVEKLIINLLKDNQKDDFFHDLTSTIKKTTNHLKAIHANTTYSFDPSKVKHAPVKDDDNNLRCYNCGRVIQDAVGCNIHCAPCRDGLQCQYCNSVNTV